MKDTVKRIREIKSAYKLLNRAEGFKTWSESEYLAALLGDIGDLSKQLLARKGFAFARKGDTEKMSRELADCLWDIFALADELGIDLDQEFSRTLKRLENKLSERKIK